MLNAFAKVSTVTRSQPTVFATEGAVILPGSIGKAGHRVVADVPTDIPEEQMLAPDGAGIDVTCTISYTDVFEGDWETTVGWAHGRGRRWYTLPHFKTVVK
jgi:hypothetical protein